MPRPIASRDSRRSCPRGAREAGTPLGDCTCERRNAARPGSIGWPCCWREMEFAEPLAESVDPPWIVVGGGVGLDSRETFIVQVSTRTHASTGTGNAHSPMLVGDFEDSRVPANEGASCSANINGRQFYPPRPGPDVRSQAASLPHSRIDSCSRLRPVSSPASAPGIGRQRACVSPDAALERRKRASPGRDSPAP